LYGTNASADDSGWLQLLDRETDYDGIVHLGDQMYADALFKDVPDNVTAEGALRLTGPPPANVRLSARGVCEGSPFFEGSSGSLVNSDNNANKIYIMADKSRRWHRCISVVSRLHFLSWGRPRRFSAL